MNTFTKITTVAAMLYLGSFCYASSNEEFNCENLKKRNLEEVISQKAKTSEDFYCKANAYRLNGQYDVALILLNGIDLKNLTKKQKEQVLISIAATYREKNDLEKAKETYLKVLELKPSKSIKKHIEQILVEIEQN